MRSEEFRKVKVYSNWSYLDSYDGTHENLIQDGDVVEVLWPDGTRAVKTLVVRKTSEEDSDMGQRVTIPIQTAYFVEKVRGQDLLVKLNETKIQVRRKV